MFSDWPSESIPQNDWGDEYPISAFKDILPWTIGRDFVAGTAKHLYDGLGLTKPKPSGTNETKIHHDKQLQIIMPAIGYGLSFPLHEHEVLKNCVYIYNEWLSALLPEPKQSVPVPVLHDPNHYAKIIIKHFYYLFVPRNNEASDDINRQALLCHKVLRTLQEIAKSSNIVREDTWQTLLLFLLHINSALLSPPAIINDAGEQLGDRVLSVLFETWLQACAKSFPPPPLWNALRESCQRWRHRPGLIGQWNRINKALTVKLLSFMYGPSFVLNFLKDNDLNIVPSEMSQDCIAQVWFRILHIIGNPVDLSCQDTISNTPAFLKYAITSDLVIEPYQHPCLMQLPDIFLTAMRGISTLVDAFLSEPGSIKHHVKGKPKCNSVLHLFGPWLFEAAFINCNFHTSSTSRSEHGSFSGSFSGSASRRPTSVFISEGPKMSDASDSSHLGPSYFQAGKAEALGALCRIFCSKKTGEEIVPTYLARFYLAIKEGLTLNEDYLVASTEEPRRSSILPKANCSETSASILLNGPTMFCVDLDGVSTLVPSVLCVLHVILMDTHEINVATKESNRSVPMLRRAATLMLLSLLPLPLHFQGLGLKELNSGNNERLRLPQLKAQLVNLVSGALQVETDATNIQMLLAGLVFCVQDATLFEAVDVTPLQSLGSDRDSNIQYSASSETMSSADFSSLMEDGSEYDSSSIGPPVMPKHLNDPDSAHGLYIRAIYLVSHCLMSSWTKDVNVSLAGLELLSNLAQLNFGDHETNESKCAVKWLCDYIVFQCSRPRQMHSKDLHSMIVAAFHCASVWLIPHPYLLQDQECLRLVLEVIELGISGSKSQSTTTDKPKYKHEKELRPVSKRVRDAAEALLSCVLSQVGSFPSACGIESMSSLLDELTLLKHCNSYQGCEPLTKEAASQHFRYFVIQNSILLALLEQPLGNNEDPQPTVTVLIRGPFGRSAWTMQLRHLPRHKSCTKFSISNPGRPLPMGETGTKHSVSHKYFPDSVDRIPICKADKSIPSLQQVIINDDKAEMDHEKVLQTLEHQIQFEESIKKQIDDQKLPYPDVEVECSAPPLCQEFQTARLLLAHLGLLSLDNLQVTETSPNLVSLDSSQPSFTKDVECLDSAVNRTIDTVHLFYVKAGQTTVEEIVSNAKFGDVHSYFLEFIKGLGWAVNVDTHPGWTGHCSRGTKPTGLTSVEEEQGVPYNGLSQVLYWADALCEVAFLAPTFLVPLDLIDQHCDGVSQADSDCLASFDADGEGSSLSSHTSQISAGTENRSVRFGRQTAVQCCSNHRIFVVWLESQDDQAVFPKNDFLSLTTTGLESPNWKDKEFPIYVIFIHPLSNGLFKIKLSGVFNKLTLAGPLVNGQVVSRRVLGTLVRQTALNMCRRKRLENDSYQPPHVRRKFKIQDMVEKYKFELTESEFYTKLFMNPID